MTTSSFPSGMKVGDSHSSPPAGFVLMAVPGAFPNLAGPFYICERPGEQDVVGAWISELQCNSEGFAHGGYLLTFADFAMSYTLKGITLNLSADFIRPVPLGTWIEARIMTRRRSANLIFADAMAICAGKDALRVSGLFKPFEKKR